MTVNILTAFREAREKTGFKIAQSGVPQPVIDNNYIRQFKTARVTISAVNADAIAFAWQNPEDSKIFVIRMVLYLITQAALAATLNVGTAADAVTENNDIFAAQALNTTGVIDNQLVAGSGTGNVFKLDEAGGATDYITGTVKTQNATALVAYAYIEYITV